MADPPTFPPFSYPSLAAFASAARPDAAAPSLPPWAYPAPPPLASLRPLGLGGEVEDLLDTVVALQRADWLEDGVFLGPRSWPESYADLLHAARALHIPVPPAVVSTASSQVFGTDGRAFLHLNSYLLRGATEAERRFMIGQLCGHIAARQVTWITARALLVDQGGLRAVAGRALGPALDVLLAPLSFGARLALARWHRAAEISADRAGMLCGGFEAAGSALLRQALGVNPHLKTADYLDQLRAARERGSPGRWAEWLGNRPWTHKRLAALEAFGRSEPWVQAGNQALGEPVLSKTELDAWTGRLLVGG